MFGGEGSEKAIMKIDLNRLQPRDAHDLMTSAIIPRPIAWVCSVSAQGAINLAPFSFFTGITWCPATPVSYTHLTLPTKRIV